MKKNSVWILLGVSTVLMVAGWILPLLTIKITFNVPLIGEQTILNETRSLLGTIEKLSEDGNLFPALLITFFGILVPLVKVVSMVYVLSGSRNAHIVARSMFSINKWAMADVFAMSILISFLTAESMANISATPQIGFYVFASYVILSGITSQLAFRLKREPLR
jgi:uncharacterized paraquat-inducible protein A